MFLESVLLEEEEVSPERERDLTKITQLGASQGIFGVPSKEAGGRAKGGFCPPGSCRLLLGSPRSPSLSHPTHPSIVFSLEVGGQSRRGFTSG